MGGPRRPLPSAPLGLLAQLEEGVLDFNIGQRVNLGERVEADIEQPVRARDVRKAVDGPRGLVASEERHRAARHAVQIGRKGLVDGVENVLPPTEQIVPHDNVVPRIGQALAPCRQHAFEVGDELIARCRCAVGRSKDAA